MKIFDKGTQYGKNYWHQPTALVVMVGNDTLAGGLGNDLIYGNDGNDILRGDLNSRSPGGSLAYLVS